MAAWREVNSTKAAGAGQWIGPHHPCKLQIRGQHMWLKTNIKIDMSCTFKQADTTEPRRRKAQEPCLYRSPRISRLEVIPQERGLTLRDMESGKLLIFASCKDARTLETRLPEQIRHLPPPNLLLRAKGSSSDISPMSATCVCSLPQAVTTEEE